MLNGEPSSCEALAKKYNVSEGTAASLQSKAIEMLRMGAWEMNRLKEVEEMIQEEMTEPPKNAKVSVRIQDLATMDSFGELTIGDVTIY